MSKVIEGIKYADSHEWVKVEGNVGIIGISDYAQHSLGDIVYVDLPSEGEEINKGEEFGAVESVKAASDLYSPVSGTIIEINSALESEPELINLDDPVLVSILVDEFGLTFQCAVNLDDSAANG